MNITLSSDNTGYELHDTCVELNAAGCSQQTGKTIQAEALCMTLKPPVTIANSGVLTICGQSICMEACAVYVTA